MNECVRNTDGTSQLGDSSSVPGSMCAMLGPSGYQRVTIRHASVTDTFVYFWAPTAGQEYVSEVVQGRINKRMCPVVPTNKKCPVFRPHRSVRPSVCQLLSIGDGTLCQNFTWRRNFYKR